MEGIIDILMKATSDFSTVNVRGDSLLHLLITSGYLYSGFHFSLLDSFIRLTGHLNTQNVFGNTPIFEVKS